jgi:hypothetical protein
MAAERTLWIGSSLAANSDPFCLAIGGVATRIDALEFARDQTISDIVEPGAAVLCRELGGHPMAGTRRTSESLVIRGGLHRHDAQLEVFAARGRPLDQA